MRKSNEEYLKERLIDRDPLLKELKANGVIPYNDDIYYVNNVKFPNENLPILVQVA
jgi:hypothetical protein